MLLCSSYYPFKPDDDFYASTKGKAFEDHLNVCGFGLPNFERAINSFDKRVLLFEESKLQLNKVKVYPIPIPESIFNEKGRKRITVTLSFTPETRLTRGDSYLGNRMKYYLFHSLNPQILVECFGVIDSTEDEVIPESIKKFKLDLSPGISIRDKGCHQKAWLDIKTKHIFSPVSLVLINYNKWMYDESIQTDYCLSVVFEHEKEIDLYNQIRSNIQTRARVR
jgi:hypothetical protein